MAEMVGLEVMRLIRGLELFRGGGGARSLLAGEGEGRGCCWGWLHDDLWDWILAVSCCIQVFVSSLLELGFLF